MFCILVDSERWAKLTDLQGNSIVTEVLYLIRGVILFGAKIYSLI